MGAPEAVPFADPEAAARFAAENGGKVYGFEEIPPDAILSAVDDGATDAMVLDDRSSDQVSQRERGAAATHGHGSGAPGGTGDRQ